jgi:RNA polymerase sigma factor (sigma-70 family)
MEIENIIKKYGNFIKSEIYTYDKDDYVVSEVYQKVIIRLWNKSPTTITLAYLSKLVRFTFIDDYRRNKKHLHHVPIDYVDFCSNYNADYLVENKESKIESDLFMDLFAKKLDNLKQSQKEVVLLRFMDYKYIDISKILNTNLNSTISQMNYAKKHLKK